MGNLFAAGKHAFGFCDVCSFRFKLPDLKKLVVNTKETNIKACPQCWTPDQPQLQVGRFPVNDPQALREPRPDNSYPQSREVIVPVYNFVRSGYTSAGGAVGKVTVLIT